MALPSEAIGIMAVRESHECATSLTVDKSKSNIVPCRIDKPFDPSMLKAEVKNTTIGELCSMLKNDLIDLQPDFQRNADLWSAKKKSQLIESLILGLPLPSFYFFVDRENKKWVVIDGLQRLCSLKDFFVDKKLRLQGLQFIEETHKSRMVDDFSYFEQLEMSMRSVTLNIISGESSVEAKYIMFQRINSNGTKLQPAEIRNALYHGPSMEFAKELSNQLSKDYGISCKRLNALDYALRYIAFYLCGYEKYQDDRMNDFIGNVLTYMNEHYQEEDYTALQRNFTQALDVCSKLLGNDVFRKPLTAQEKRNKNIQKNPLSISLFEATMCAVSKLNTEQIDILLSKKLSFVQLYIEMFKDPDFAKYISNGTNKYKSVKCRFTSLEQIIDKTLNS